MARPKHTTRRTTIDRPGTAYLSRSVLCTAAGVSESELALWEYEELITPVTTLSIDGQSEPVYDPGVLRRIRTIRSLSEDLGVNLPGIGVALRLIDQLHR
jgi:DNA-binding transcriptional MerR regulator